MNQFNTSMFLYGTRTQPPTFPTFNSPNSFHPQFFSNMIPSTMPSTFTSAMIPNQFNGAGSPIFFKPKNELMLNNGTLHNRIPVLTKPTIDNSLLLQQLAPMSIFQRQQSERLKTVYQSQLNYQFLLKNQAELFYKNKNQNPLVINPLFKKEEEHADVEAKCSTELATQADNCCVKKEEAYNPYTKEDELPTSDEGIENKPKAAKVPKKNRKSKKIKKRRNACGHPDKQHYAKGMCNNCYHKYCRISKPTKCDHEQLYAKGLCQKCYLLAYNQKKAEKILAESA